MRVQGFATILRGTLAIILLSISIAGATTSLSAQESEAAKEAAEKEAKRQGEVEDALKTLSDLLKTEKDQNQVITQLKEELRRAKEEASRSELEAQIKKELEKLAQTEQQVSALITGLAANALEEEPEEPFNLQSELESLVQPFIKMMKDATENARQIEALNDTIALARKRQDLASRAIKRLDLLIEVEAKNNPLIEGEPKNKESKNPVRTHLQKSLETWQTRAKEAVTLEETAQQQLSIRLAEDSSGSGAMASYATEFFQERGFNLFLALSLSGLVLLIAELISRTTTWLRRRQGVKRNFWTRLGSLVFRMLSITVAFVVMLIVFNMMNDWLLLGVASLFALAAAWLGITMMPSIIEQGTLLLNLGAVQEDERIIIDGVPWRVKQLDLYTDLVNPVLDGGNFTVPVRQLVGMHSRPSGPSEPWFPTKTGDWIVYDEGEFGQVVSQSPELVQIKDVAGSLTTFETAAFLEKAPRNLTTGFRIQTEFGLDYRHQKEASNAIPSLLKEFMEKGLKRHFGDNGVLRVDVDLLRAGDSAIIFEVETFCSGFMAPRYEDFEREIAHLLIDACNTHNWTIPFPQMVLHRPAGSSSLPAKNPVS